MVLALMTASALGVTLLAQHCEDFLSASIIGALSASSRDMLLRARSCRPIQRKQCDASDKEHEQPYRTQTGHRLVANKHTQPEGERDVLC